MHAYAFAVRHTHLCFTRAFEQHIVCMCESQRACANHKQTCSVQGCCASQMEMACTSVAVTSASTLRFLRQVTDEQSLKSSKAWSAISLLNLCMEATSTIWRSAQAVDWDEQPQVSGQSPALPAESKQNMCTCFRWNFFPIPFPA